MATIPDSLAAEPHSANVGRSGRIQFNLSRDLHMLSAPAGPQAESIRVLRTYLTTQHLGEGRRTLAVCSTARESGCTYIAANLALAFAQTGLKVLLMDCNMRDPGIDKFIAPRTEVGGLLQYLTEPATLTRGLIAEDALPNLSLLFAGGVTESAQELLGGSAFKTLVSACVRDYDLTIVDTPAANICSDARQISALVRYALLVTRRNQSYVADVRTFAQELQGDRVKMVGTYLNDY